MIKEHPVSQRPNRVQANPEDGLGPNSDIGTRLRALYGTVQDESVPSHLLDLLEKLDMAEEAQRQAPKGRAE